MSLWIGETGLHDKVIHDLQTICQDPTLQIDIGLITVELPDGETMEVRGNGQVTFGTDDGRPISSSVGTNLIAYLVDRPEWVGIRGELPDFSVHPVTGWLLKDKAGVVVLDVEPPGHPSSSEIFYDVTNCYYYGAWAEGPGGSKVPNPTPVILFHELAHVEDILKGTFNTPNPEPYAISRENEFRDTLGISRRSTHFGGCNTPETGLGPGPDFECFVVTAAYGSPLEPEVQFLRNFRDNIVSKTRRGKEEVDRFHKHYQLISPFIVREMERDPEIKSLVKWGIVNPIVMFLKTALNFPDANIDHLEEPWKSFLLELRDDLEETTNWIDIPNNFNNLSASSAAEEIGLVLRYVFRKSVTRDSYLCRLEELKQIPLSTSLKEREVIAERLRTLGISEEYIIRILKEVRK